MESTLISLWLKIKMIVQYFPESMNNKADNTNMDIFADAD